MITSRHVQLFTLLSLYWNRYFTVTLLGLYHKTVASFPFQKRMLFGTMTWLWARGVTPGDLVRGFGPVGMYIPSIIPYIPPYYVYLHIC
jgi:hypothetical protein